MYPCKSNKLHMNVFPVLMSLKQVKDEFYSPDNSVLLSQKTPVSKSGRYGYLFKPILSKVRKMQMCTSFASNLRKQCLCYLLFN